MTPDALVRAWQVFTWRSRRAWQLLRLYWNTEDCDWSTIVLLMRHQIQRTRLHMAKHAIVVGWERSARQMLIAETLLDRIRDDAYYEIADRRFPGRGKHWASFIREIERQDMDMLLPLLRRYLKTWWD